MTEPPVVPLIAYQSREDWMGEPVLTLADVWPDNPRAIIVGLNPPPVTVATGHYYQGRVGQRQMRRLVDAGLLAEPEDGRTFERVALDAGIGFTDLVKRPTPREGGVRAAELAFGRERLARALESRGVGLVISVYRHPAELLVGKPSVLGLQARTTSWGARVFRLPGPYVPRVEADRVMAGLVELVAPRTRGVRDAR